MLPCLAVWDQYTMIVSLIHRDSNATYLNEDYIQYAIELNVVHSLD